MTRTTKRHITYILFIAAIVACCCVTATAQEKPAPAPTAPAAAEPPPAAIILKLRGDLRARDGLILQLQEQIVRLQSMLLEADRARELPGIVKAAGGKPGDGYDFDKLAVVPAAASAPVQQTPPPDGRKP